MSDSERGDRLSVFECRRSAATFCVGSWEVRCKSEKTTFSLKFDRYLHQAAVTRE